MKKNSFIVAAAMTGIMLSSTLSFAGDAPAAAAADTKCVGANACKGTGACGGAGHDCAGKNACKGKGWTKTSKADCEAAMKKDKKVKMEKLPS